MKKIVVLFAVLLWIIPASAQVGDYVLVIHGGAGSFNPDASDDVVERYHASLAEALSAGKAVLETGGAAVDAVEAAINILEDNPLFNSARGAVVTSEGHAELDASIMRGEDLNCGAVSSVTTVKNPISLARKVMEESKHVFFTSEGAERLAGEYGLEIVENDYFVTPVMQARWLKYMEDGKGTVGAAALDTHGNIAAGTSTGGTSFKTPGRVGDSPIIGAGTYANNKTCAVSATGWGEKFIMHTVAYNISALMEFKGLTLEEAANEMIFERLEENDGGIIAVDAAGNYVFSFNTASMLRGVCTSDGTFETAIYKDDE